jgi:hypothetical protein
MGLVRDELTWGATHEPMSPQAPDVRDWTVEVESEPLGALGADSTLSRFAHDARRLAHDAAPECSVRQGRFGMVLTVAAASRHEAALKGEHLFKTALDAALWPRSAVAPSARCDVFVMPAADFASAA